MYLESGILIQNPKPDLDIFIELGTLKNFFKSTQTVLNIKSSNPRQLYDLFFIVTKYIFNYLLNN